MNDIETIMDKLQDQVDVMSPEALRLSEELSKLIQVAPKPVRVKKTRPSELMASMPSSLQPEEL